MRRTIAPAITAVLAACALLGPAAPAQAAACPDADVQPTAGNLAQMRAATLCLLNAERTPRGLTALHENARLTEASQSYSELMVVQQFFAHVTPGGVNLTERLKSVGYVSDRTSWVIGENLAWGTGGLGTPVRIMQAWMESPGHRENILTPDFREVGIGIVVGSPNSRTAPGAATYTTDFGTIDGAGADTPAAALPVTRTTKRKAKPRSCAALRRAKARGRISKASRKRLARCNRSRARARSARG